MKRSVRIAGLAGMLLLACFAQMANRPAAWLDPDRSEPFGTHCRTFPSQLVKGEVSYQIYLPPDYETATTRRYPVVYWLHGLGGNQHGGMPFVRHLDAQIRNGKAPAMIVVLANGMRDSFYNDSPDGARPVESVIVKELIPEVDSTCRTIARREARAVEGFSMGGYGAAHLGFKYPEVFGMVGIMSGALLRPEGMAAMKNSQPTIFEKMFGSDLARVTANDPFQLARKNMDAIRGKTVIRIAVGGDDSLLPRNRAMHELLDELKVEHEYEVVPGIGHAAPSFYEALGERAFGYYRKALGLSNEKIGN